MNNRYKWRGVNVDLSNSKPVDHSEPDSEIVKSARSAINGIIQSGFEGVGVVNTYSKKTGKTEGTLLIDASTIEGRIAAAIMRSLPKATEPFDPNHVINLIAFEYMCLGLPFPKPTSKRKGQQR
ncbi:MAG: hypothetical protein ACOYBW_09325 [Fluviibacter phosphoraccumulans]